MVFWKSVVLWTVMLTVPLITLAVEWPDSRAVENLTLAKSSALLEDSPFVGEDTVIIIKKGKQN